MSSNTPTSEQIHILEKRWKKFENRYAPTPIDWTEPQKAAYLQKVFTTPKEILPVEIEVYRKTLFQITKEMGIKINKHNQFLYREACYFFSRNPGGKWTLNKGLFLYGGCGTGKTTFFQAIQRTYTLLQVPFAINNMPRICAGMLAEGKTDIMRFAKEQRVLDDAGAESAKIMSYGNAVHILPDLLMLRYEEFQKNQTLTHITTNLTPADLKNRAGMDERVLSRMNEMFTIVHLPGPDHRKQ